MMMAPELNTDVMLHNKHLNIPTPHNTDATTTPTNIDTGLRTPRSLTCCSTAVRVLIHLCCWQVKRCRVTEQLGRVQRKMGSRQAVARWQGVVTGPCTRGYYAVVSCCHQLFHECHDHQQCHDLCHEPTLTTREHNMALDDRP